MKRKLEKKYEKIFLIYSEPESCGFVRILFESNKIESEDATYVGECLAHEHKKKGNLFQDCLSRRKLLCTME